MKLTTKKTAYPSKTTLNLAMKEGNGISPKKAVLPLILLIAAAVLFGKFAVADRLARVDRAEARLAALQREAAELEAAVVDYDQVLEQYGRYSVGWMTDEEQQIIPRTDMLDLVETELMPVSEVRRLSANGNVLSAEVGGITLEDASLIVQKLYQRPDVTNVAVYTASTKTEVGDQAAVSLIITMTAPEGGNGK